jgi:23S rRNA (cytidine1920-2'-O)/16S rRNA (cytidine1409-2'-O)-methyltransferase
VHEAGLATSRERARALILAGRVRAAGCRVRTAGELLPPDAALLVEGDPIPYVSRGGVKLAHALDRFGLSVAGRRCLDVGASTGGFTDCLLQRGAGHVVAVDVGRGQIDWTLRNDPRVTVLERTNARDLRPEQVGAAPGLVVADVSFISLTKVLPAVVACAPDADLVVLVKPQFEAGRASVGRGGVVRDPVTWRACLAEVEACLVRLGCSVRGATASPLAGPAGNRELFLWATAGEGGRVASGGALDAAVAEAVAATADERVTSRATSPRRAPGARR